MELADILSQDGVVACAKVTSKRQLLQLLADRAAAQTGLEAHAIFETLMKREQLGSTGLGNGIAIPHGKLKGLPQVVAVFARLEHPIEFEAVDDQPVDLAIMLLAPEGAGADHLKALSRVARIMRTESLVETLRHTKEPEKLYEALIAPLASNYAA
ncbi:MAG TPA: PTS IIA-like nitrogen regulatory protein PtsN [Devosiaceae bacterium]